MSETTLEKIKSLPSTESKAMLEVRDARAKLHEELEGLSQEERRRFFEEEHRLYREWVERIHDERVKSDP